ncbi:phage tail spike protein [Bacillus sp. J33]|uniref:phage tail spike protein n=1 Tax=Bacillus sp. J33 TaxID=935836 RepID=UPI00047BBA0D|nr:phage tail spike protein [Bacillus sp. J33]
MIHVLDYQTEKILTTLENKPNAALFWNDIHEDTLKNNQETFDFTMQATVPAADFVSKRNLVVIPDEDGFFREFIILETYQYDRKKEVKCNASFTDIAKQKIIDPVVLEGQTIQTAANHILPGTDWQLGIAEGLDLRKVEFTEHTDALSALRQIASLFELEIRFRVETKANRITGRYVDFIEREGAFYGKEIVLGKDLVGVKRRENSDIVTALIGLGPEKEDGTRLVVRVEDEDALQRWAKKRPDGTVRHLWGIYTPETSDLDMTEARLTTLTRAELDKRINTSVLYEADAVSIEHILGYEHEKVRKGDTVRIKDTSYVPPLYLDARIISVKRAVSNRSKKTFILGDFIEYTEEEIMATFKALKAVLQKKASEAEVVAAREYAEQVAGTAEGNAKEYAEAIAVELSEIEKLKGHKIQLLKEKAAFDERFNSVNNHPQLYDDTVQTELTASKTNFDQKYNALVSVIDAVIVDKIISDSERSDLELKTEEYRLAITRYESAHAAALDSISSGKAADAEAAATDFVETYANKKISQSTIAPSNPVTGDLWIDTSVSPYIWKRWNGTEWSNAITVTTEMFSAIGIDAGVIKTGVLDAERIQIGSTTNFATGYDPSTKETPAGALSKANTAESNAKAYVNALKVGGRNLHKHTDIGDHSLDYWQAWNTTASTLSIQNRTINGAVRKVLQLWYTASTTSGNAIAVHLKDSAGNYFAVMQGMKYTVSFLVSNHSAITQLDYCYLLSNSNANQHLGNIVLADHPIVADDATSEDFRRVTFTFTAPFTAADCRLLLGARTPTTTPWIRFLEVQIEEGDKATNWSPAVEDNLYKGILYNGVKIDATSGFMAIRSDGKVRTIANATDGFKVQKLINSTWTDMISADSNGDLAYAGKLSGATGNYTGSVNVNDGVNSASLSAGLFKYWPSGTSFQYNQLGGGAVWQYIDEEAMDGGVPIVGVGASIVYEDLVYVSTGTRLPGGKLKISAANNGNSGSGVVEVVGELRVTKDLYMPSNGRIHLTGTSSGIKLDTASGIVGTNNGYLFRDYNNGNVTVSAAGGILYLGYENTTVVRVSTNVMDWANTGCKIDMTGNIARLQRSTSDYLAYSSGSAVLYFGGVAKHSFGSDGSKTGGSIVVDGENLGMSPIDSPQVLIEYIDFSIPLNADGVKVFLDPQYRKSVTDFAVFPNNGKIIEKGYDYYVIAGEGTADCRIVGERVDHAGAFWADMSILQEDTDGIMEEATPAN